MPTGGPTNDILSYRFWAIEDFRKFTSGPNGKLNAHWSNQIKKDPLMLDVRLCIDMVFGGGERLRASTDPVTAYKRMPAQDVGSSDRVEEVVYEPILVDQPRIVQQYNLGNGSSSARSFSISFAENNINPYEIIKRGRFIAGWAEVSLMVDGQDWEDRFVIMVGDMTGGVVFASVDEIIETEIVDPLETTDILITPYTVVANTGLSATWFGADRVNAGTVVANDIKINSVDIRVGSDIVVTDSDGTGTLVAAINSVSSQTSVSASISAGVIELIYVGGGKIDPSIVLSLTANGGSIMNGTPGSLSITQGSSSTVPESYVGYRYPLVYNSPVNVPAIRLSSAVPPYFLCWYASDVTPSSVNVDGRDYSSSNSIYPYTFSKVNDGSGANYWKVEFSPGNAEWTGDYAVTAGTLVAGDILIDNTDIISTSGGTISVLASDSSNTLVTAINGIFSSTGVTATNVGGKIKLSKSANRDISIRTTSNGGWILTGTRSSLNATTRGTWSENTSVFVSGSRDNSQPDENVVKVIKRLCTNWSTLGHHGISDNLFAIAESKIINLAKPSLIVNGSGGADSASAIEYIESTICASFPMISMTWGNGGYGPVITDRTRGGIRMRLIVGQSPVLDRATAIKETSKSSLVNKFTLRYNFDPVTNSYNSYTTRDFNNSTLCRISQEQCGVRERSPIDSTIIYDSMTADYVLDWLVNHLSMPSYYVEYDCFQPLFLTLNLGDNITITDPNISSEEMTATVEKLELNSGKCRMGVRLWLLYDNLSGVSVGGAGT